MEPVTEKSLEKITFELRGLFQDAIECYEEKGYRGVDLVKMAYNHIKNECNELVRAYLEG